MPDTTRRRWIKTAALAGVAPALLPGCSERGPEGKVALGVIGCGYMGTRNLESFLTDDRVDIAAVCDVDRGSSLYWKEDTFGREPAADLVEEKRGKRPATYIDYREMIADEKLDAVLIATTDHWHALQSITALEAGLHVYCQKPLSLTIAEGRAVANAAAAAGKAFQVGSQQRSDQHIHRACEMVRNGLIGKVERVEVGFRGGNPNYNRNAKHTEPEPVPEGLDYDLWLGPAPEAPFCRARLHANWRWHYDYAGGNICDWGAHHLDIAQWGLGTDGTGPLAIRNVAATLPEPGSFYNTPTAFAFDFEYADGVVVGVKDYDNHEDVEGGIKFIGEDGDWLYCDRGEFKASSLGLRMKSVPDDGVKLTRSTQHERNFIDAVIDGRDTVCPAEVGHRSATLCHIANIAVRLGRSQLDWDPDSESFVGDDEANAMIARANLEGWGE